MITLSPNDIEFFKENGYLIKRKVLNTELMSQARQALWRDAPAELDQHNPDTWIGPFTETSDDRNNVYRGFSWKYRAPGDESWMLNLLAKDPSVWAMAEQLLGEGTLQEPERVRGIYCIMPEGKLPERPYHCHVDRHPFHLGVVGYIDNVYEDGGGFNVWPGSHKRFYYAFDSQYTFEPNEGLEPAQAEINAQKRVDCYGQAGDIVFWHHRIGHSGGHNRTRRIRQAVLYDFKRTDLESKLQSPPQENMWADWEGICDS